MVNDKVIQLYRVDDDTYSCYDYLKLDAPLDESHLKLFRQEIGKLLFTYAQYLKERENIHCIKDTDLKLEMDEFLSDAYEFSDVEAGIKPLSLLDNYYVSVSTFFSLSKTKDKKELSKESLAESLINNYSQLRLRKHHPKISKKLKLETEVEDYMIDDAVSKIMGIFEKIQVMQSGDEYNNNMLEWNLRVRRENYNCDFYEAATYQAMLLLRKNDLRRKIERFGSPNKVFDDLEIRCLKDEFRYQLAGAMGVLDYDKAKKVVESEFESNHFDAQYTLFSKEFKLRFDKEAQKFLRNVAAENDLPYQLGL